jgi:undecaprenyl phosphate-alpha-L-ara4N flippase subunit ArnE
MRLKLILLCLLFSLSVPAGQILLKFAAVDVKARLSVSWLSAGFSVWLAAAVLLYFASMILWLWLLNHMPLSSAYPFALLGAALVPAAAHVFIGEPLSPSFLAGLALVIGGIAIIHLA